MYLTYWVIFKFDDLGHSEPSCNGELGIGAISHMCKSVGYVSASGTGESKECVHL